MGTRNSLSQLIWSSLPAFRFLRKSEPKCPTVSSASPASVSPSDPVEIVSRKKLSNCKGVPTSLPVKTLPGKPDSLDIPRTHILTGVYPAVTQISTSSRGSAVPSSAVPVSYTHLTLPTN